MCERYAEALAKHHEGKIYGPGAARGTRPASDRVTSDMLRIAPEQTDQSATHYLSRRKNKFGRRGAGRYLIFASLKTTCLRATGSNFFNSSLAVLVRGFFFVT